jgi:krueppel-like factor 8/12
MHEDNAKRYKCPEDGCPFTAYYEKDLEKHKPKHTNARDYSCAQCDKTFTRPDNLKRHVSDKHRVSSN